MSNPYETVAKALKSEFNPHPHTFVRVKAQTIKATIDQALGSDRGPIDWEVFHQALSAQGLLIYPSIEDVSPDEEVRVFIEGSPLVRLLDEFMFPSPSGDGVLAKTLSKLRGNGHRRPHHRGERPFQKAA